MSATKTQADRFARKARAVATLADVVAGDYFPAQKNEWLAAGRSFLADVRARLGGDGEVRVCRGGPAVPGEIVLHTDKLYIILCAGPLGPASGLMYRTCQGRKDYTGGPNRYYSYRALADDPDGFVGVLRALQEKGAM
jgi:hypothetical protein